MRAATPAALNQRRGTTLPVILCALPHLWRTLRRRGWAEACFEYAVRMRTLALDALDIDWNAGTVNGYGLFGKFTLTTITRNGTIIFRVLYDGASEAIEVPALGAMAW